MGSKEGITRWVGRGQLDQEAEFALELTNQQQGILFVINPVGMFLELLGHVCMVFHLSRRFGGKVYYSETYKIYDVGIIYMIAGRRMN